MVPVTMQKPWCGMTRVVVCKSHFHHFTAKRHSGSAESHEQLWDVLASTIGEHCVRILACDFNVSLWIVAREMRQQGVQATLAAAFAWAGSGLGEAKCDSCGMFVFLPP